MSSSFPAIEKWLLCGSASTFPQNSQSWSALKASVRLWVTNSLERVVCLRTTQNIKKWEYIPTWWVNKFVMSRRALFFLLACYLVSSTHALIKYDSTYLITPGIKKKAGHHHCSSHYYYCLIILLGLMPFKQMTLCSSFGPTTRWTIGL